MNKLLFLFLTFSSFLCEAQLSKAITAYKNGHLTEAKNTIDSLSDEAALDKDSQVWFARGLIYEKLYLTKDTVYKKLSENPLQESYLALKKAQEGKDKKYATAAIKKIDSSTTAYLLKEGKRFISVKKMDEGISLLEYYTLIKPSDTLIYYEIALAAEKGKSYDIAKTNYSKLLLLKFYTPSVYKSLYLIYKDFEKNYDKAYEIVRDGHKKYPLDKDFMKMEITLLTDMQKYAQVLRMLDSAATIDPNDRKIYLFNIGSIYQRLDSIPKAIDHYNKSLQMDPQYPYANLNLGSIYYDKASKIYENINKMNYEQYNKSGKAELLKANVLANQALPYLETYYFETKDVDIKSLLIDLYKNLKMRSKIRAIEKEDS